MKGGRQTGERGWILKLKEKSFVFLMIPTRKWKKTTHDIRENICKPHIC